MRGKKYWVIPDCELPEEGEGQLKGHESVIVLNKGKKPADIRVTLYYTDSDKVDGISWYVAAERVRCFRMNAVTDMCGVRIPYNTQYAMRLISNVPVVVQYGRLDNRQSNLAYYTTLGYGG